MHVEPLIQVGPVTAQLFVNFLRPYQPAHLMVEVPLTTTTSAKLERPISVDLTGTVIHWNLLWRDGLLVR